MMLLRSSLSFSSASNGGYLNASVMQRLYKFGFEQDKDRRLHRRGLYAASERLKASIFKVFGAAVVGVL